jgi:hypothetical protein
MTRARLLPVLLAATALLTPGCGERERRRPAAPAPPVEEPAPSPEAPAPAPELGALPPVDHRIYYPRYHAAVVIGEGGQPVYVYTITPRATLSLSYAEGGVEQIAELTHWPTSFYRVGDVPVYAAAWQPEGVHAEIHGPHWYWVGGADTTSPEVTTAIAKAAETRSPTAGSTVISYALADTRVFLTEEPPLAGVHRVAVGDRFAWIAGVRSPTDAQENALRSVAALHESQGAQQLEREIRDVADGVSEHVPGLLEVVPEGEEAPVEEALPPEGAEAGSPPE